MITKNDVTFIIPIFDLTNERLNNLKFILPKIVSVGCKVYLAEQVSNAKSIIQDEIQSIIPNEYRDNFKHILYIHDNKEIHKTGIINWAVKNFIDTKYAWVNDADFYMKYNEVFYTNWESAFIQPYETAKKLNKQDSYTLLSGGQIDVSYVDFDAEYISLYGALSFILEKDEFIDIGGMNENLFGWAQEDVEFSNRLKEREIKIQKLDFKGIHLWHRTKDDETKNDSSRKIDPSFQHKIVLPKTKDLAVVTCYFNWCGFMTPARNFHRFLREMKNNKIPLYGVELSMTNHFETKGMKGWTHIKVTKENMCFQKEACLNLVEKKVPDQYTKIAWIDCDLLFMNDRWYTDASKKLDQHKLIQLYTHGYNTDRCGRIVTEFPSVMYMKDKTTSDKWFKHSGYPGGAWAARRELWRNGGLYPYAVMGGGDTVFVYTLFDYDFAHTKYERIGVKKNSNFEFYNKWRKSIMDYIREDVSFIENKFIHEWHGDKKNRNYTDRHDILRHVDIKTQVKINADGIIEFCNIKDNLLYDETYEYFLGRDEDGFFDDMKHFGDLKYKKYT